MNKLVRSDNFGSVVKFLSTHVTEREQAVFLYIVFGVDSACLHLIYSDKEHVSVYIVTKFKSFVWCSELQKIMIKKFWLKIKKKNYFYLFLILFIINLINLIS